MCELINVTQHKEGDREFVQTIGSSFTPESVKQGAIIKIAGKPIRVAQIIFVIPR
jgi:hypothetical protein